MSIRIDHIALYVFDIERSRDFYVTYLGGKCGSKYVNEQKCFASYFISFGSNARLEIMTRADISVEIPAGKEIKGWTHLSFSVGSKDAVRASIERFRTNGFPVVGEPRTTGDGYYEGVILDPDGNRVEIVE